MCLLITLLDVQVLESENFDFLIFELNIVPGAEQTHVQCLMNEHNKTGFCGSPTAAPMADVTLSRLLVRKEAGLMQASLFKDLYLGVNLVTPTD